MHGNRMQLGDHHQAGAIRRMDDIAGIDLADAGAPVDRRADRGVAQVGTRGFDQRVVLLHQRLVLRHLRLGRVGLLGGGVFVRHKLLVAGVIGLRIGQQGLVGCLLRQRLVERRLIGARIDLRQHFALLDVLAFLEVHRGQRPIDHRLDGDGVECLHGAEPVEVDRHVLLRHRRVHHRHHLPGARVHGFVRAAGMPEPDHRADSGQHREAGKQHWPAPRPSAGLEFGGVSGERVHAGSQINGSRYRDVREESQ